MEFRILGPLEIRRDDGEPVHVLQLRQRELLTTLLLYANKQLPAHTLMEALWGPQQPRAASGALRTYVWAVRRLLGPSVRLHTRPSGYLFEVAPGELDLENFDRLVADANGLLDVGDAVAAADRLEEALALWRTPLLADAPGTTFMASKAESLRARERAAQELSIGIELSLGRHRRLVPRLRALVAEDPAQEQYWGQLMLALYCSGRRAEALAAYSQARASLKEELGLEPGPDLKRLHQKVLTGAPELDAMAVASPGVQVMDGTRVVALRPQQIPPAPMDFVGRTAESTEIAVALSDTADARGVPIAVVCGRAGAGKTALASKVAHALRDRFPDGQLYAELGGTSADRPDPAEVLDDLLRSLGVPAHSVPDSLAGRSGLLRSRLADQRMLIMIDDAAEPERVLPFLPGTAGCAVLVTSRTRLTGLPRAKLIPLEGLSPDESVRLLAEIAGTGRIAAEHEAAADLAATCDHLPLALRIAGSRLDSHRNWPVRLLVEYMEEEGRRLDELTSASLSVREGVASTHSALNEGERRLFMLLGLTPAHDIPEWALATLYGRGDTRQVLDGLVDNHMLQSGIIDFTGRPRYRMDPLTAEYARELLTQVPGPERESAMERLLSGWTQYASLADRDMARDPYYPDPDPAPIRGPETAARPAAISSGSVRQHVLDDPAKWFATEEVNLRFISERACAEGRYQAAAQLGTHQFAYQYFQRNTSDIVQLWSKISEAAASAGDVAAAAKADVRLGILHAESGEDFAGLRLFERSASVFAFEGEGGSDLARSLSCVAYGRYRQQKYVTALGAAKRGLDAARRIGDRQTEYLNLSVMGTVLTRTGDRINGPALCGRVLDIARELDRPSCEIFALQNLAAANVVVAQHGAAVEFGRRGLELVSELGHEFGEAYFLVVLAEAYCGLDRHADAIEVLGRARRIFARGQAVRQEVTCLLRLASCCHAIGQRAQAVRHLEESITVFEKLSLQHYVDLVKRAIAEGTVVRVK